MRVTDYMARNYAFQTRGLQLSDPYQGWTQGRFAMVTGLP